MSADTATMTHDKLGSAGIDFPLLADPALEVIDAYSVRHPSGGMSGQDISRPATFLIDSQGRIVWRELTDNWRIRLRPERLMEQLAALP